MDALQKIKIAPSVAKRTSRSKFIKFFLIVKAVTITFNFLIMSDNKEKTLLKETLSKACESLTKLDLNQVEGERASLIAPANYTVVVPKNRQSFLRKLRPVDGAVPYHQLSSDDFCCNTQVCEAGKKNCSIEDLCFKPICGASAAPPTLIPVAPSPLVPIAPGPSPLIPGLGAPGFNNAISDILRQASDIMVAFKEVKEELNKLRQQVASQFSDIDRQIVETSKVVDHVINELEKDDF